MKPRRHTYRIELCYHGGAYHGFRRQPDRATVEGTLLDALREVSGHPRLRIAFAGATDRGVHALGQVVSFHLRAPLSTAAIAEAVERRAGEAPGQTPFFELDERLRGASLRVRAVEEVPRSFHASFSVLARRYCYVAEEDADVDRLRRLLRPLLGARDFTAFARDTPPNARTVKRLVVADATKRGGRVEMWFAASGFVRRQVRVMAATALREAARGADDDALVALASDGDRRATAPPAPAHRLCLWGVDYATL